MKLPEEFINLRLPRARRDERRGAIRVDPRDPRKLPFLWFC